MNLIRQKVGIQQLLQCRVKLAPLSTFCHPVQQNNRVHFKHSCESSQLYMHNLNHFSTSPATRLNDSPKQSSIKVPEQFKDMKFTVFYRLPSILWMRLLSRLKLYQTGLTVIILPPLTFMYIAGSIPVEVLAYCLGVTGFAGTMLYVMTFYLRRLIGLMSLSDCGRIVRLSHLTFWGRRNDVYVPLENIIPLSDLSEKPSDAYIRLRRYDTKDFLYFTLRWGHVADAEKFFSVFGGKDSFQT